jgi:hypothetical protein
MSPRLYLTQTSTCCFAELKKRKVEEHGDFILGPVSPKEYKDTVAELNGSRTKGGETATSPHAGGAPSKKTIKKIALAAAATAAAEGKARKKRDARPTSSPLLA